MGRMIEESATRGAGRLRWSLKLGEEWGSVEEFEGLAGEGGGVGEI